MLQLNAERIAIYFQLLLSYLSEDVGGEVLKKLILPSIYGCSDVVVRW
jgi:hypothetical protein